MSIASVAAQQNSAKTAATITPPTGAKALNTLSSNFNDFLKLLMTQLKNQDPTSPMDTNQFTSELMQFSGVEQQINTNASLTQLIQLTQGSEVMQASSMTGKRVTVSSDHVALQGGKGTIQFTAPATETVAFAIYSDNGTKLRDASMVAAKGSNTWTWDGADGSGHTLPDGSYKVAVAGANADDSERAAVQRDRHRHRRAEFDKRRPVATRRAVDRFLQGAVGGELISWRHVEVRRLHVEQRANGGELGSAVSLARKPKWRILRKPSGGT